MAKGVADEPSGVNVATPGAAMIGTMNIRRAQPDDLPPVLAMVRRICDLHQAWDVERFGLKGDPTGSYEGWLRRRCDDERSVFLVADAGASTDPTGGEPSRVVGYLVGTIEPEIPIYWQPECGWIHDLWVDEAFRNEGVGRQMTMLAVERFAQLGVRQVRLHTALANEPARQLFASCGFRPCVVEMLAMTAPPAPPTGKP